MEKGLSKMLFFIIPRLQKEVFKNGRQHCLWARPFPMSGKKQGGALESPNTLWQKNFCLPPRKPTLGKNFRCLLFVAKPFSYGSQSLPQFLLHFFFQYRQHFIFLANKQGQRAIGDFCLLLSHLPHESQNLSLDKSKLSF